MGPVLTWCQYYQATRLQRHCLVGGLIVTGCPAAVQDKDKPILFSMARLDTVKNLTGLAEWYGRNERLRKARPKPSIQYCPTAQPPAISQWLQPGHGHMCFSRRLGHAHGTVLGLRVEGLGFGV